MNCKRARRLLPLMAGSELTGKKREAVRFHLETCAPCQEEYEQYVFLVRETRSWLAADTVRWQKGEWQQALQYAAERKGVRQSFLIPWPFRKGWALAAMACMVLLMVTFLIRPPFVERIGIKSPVLSSGYQETGEQWREKRQQDVVSMTMISKDTGLKIVWFFNKNFDLEEEK